MFEVARGRLQCWLDLGWFGAAWGRVPSILPMHGAVGRRVPPMHVQGRGGRSEEGSARRVLGMHGGLRLLHLWRRASCLLGAMEQSL